MKRLDHLLIFTHSQKVLWRLSESNNGYSQDRHDKNQGSSGEKAIPPAPIVGFGAANSIHAAIPLLRDQESPTNKSSDGLTKPPPTSKECQKPLFVTREVLEEDGRVHDQVTSSAETKKSNEEPESWPAWHGACDYTTYRTHKQRNVKGIFATNNVGAESPEYGACKHTTVYSNCEGVLIPTAEFAIGWSCDNGLEKQNH